MLSVLHADCEGFDSLTPYQFIYLSSSTAEQLLDKRKTKVRFLGEIPSVGNVPPKQCSYSLMVKHSVVIRIMRVQFSLATPMRVSSNGRISGFHPDDESSSLSTRTTRGSFNGRTAGFDSVNEGSTPSPRSNFLCPCRLMVRLLFCNQETAVRFCVWAPCFSSNLVDCSWLLTSAR